MHISLEIDLTNADQLKALADFSLALGGISPIAVAAGETLIQSTTGIPVPLGSNCEPVAEKPKATRKRGAKEETVATPTSEEATQEIPATTEESAVVENQPEALTTETPKSGITIEKVREIATEKSMAGHMKVMKAKLTLLCVDENGTPIGNPSVSTLPESKYAEFVDYMNTL